MFMSHHQNADQNHHIKTSNKSSENVAKLKYLEMTATNQNYICKEIKSRFNSGNAYYHSIQDHLQKCCGTNVYDLKALG
jgi:hypothetical protein